MRRSSESIACLATALAKAQAALKITTVMLGQHEIATLQTTAIDQTAGIVNLTTGASALLR
jgi:hypothetical protein